MNTMTENNGTVKYECPVCGTVYDGEAECARCAQSHGTLQLSLNVNLQSLQCGYEEDRIDDMKGADTVTIFPISVRQSGTQTWLQFTVLVDRSMVHTGLLTLERLALTSLGRVIASVENRLQEIRETKEAEKDGRSC